VQRQRRGARAQLARDLGQRQPRDEVGDALGEPTGSWARAFDDRRRATLVGVVARTSAAAASLTSVQVAADANDAYKPLARIDLDSGINAISIGGQQFSVIRTKDDLAAMSSNAPRCAW
jgi:hypothetical protein